LPFYKIVNDVLTLNAIYKSSIKGSLGLVVSVADGGDLCFKYPDLGVLLIALDAINDPEFMHLYYLAFLMISLSLMKMN